MTPPTGRSTAGGVARGNLAVLKKLCWANPRLARSTADSGRGPLVPREGQGPVCRAFLCAPQIARTSDVDRWVLVQPTRTAVYARWCGRDRRVTAAPMPILSASRRKCPPRGGHRNFAIIAASRGSEPGELYASSFQPSIRPLRHHPACRFHGVASRFRVAASAIEPRKRPRPPMTFGRSQPTVTQFSVVVQFVPLPSFHPLVSLVDLVPTPKKIGFNMPIVISAAAGRAIIAEFRWPLSLWSRLSRLCRG